MPANQKTIYVYDDFHGDTPMLLGRLYVDTVRGGENYSFEYDNDWLTYTHFSLSLDPGLHPYGGRQFPNGGAIFGMFADASPDRWGRTLMRKRERLQAEKEKRKPRKLNDSDFLLGVYDETRMGGIRFKSEQMNPVPYGDELSLNVNEEDNRISVSLAIETAFHFGISEKAAREMAKEILKIVRDNWESLAVKYNITRGKMEDMRPAFSACYEHL